MIIYFTSTGNSEYVAKKLAENGEMIVSIPQAVDSGAYEFTIEPNEKVGIISPTYFWTIPSIVNDFLEKLKLHYTDKPYLYYVGTFGTTTGAASAIANQIMKAKGLVFDAMFDVKMPDTWTPMYDISNKDKVKKINQKADIQIQILKKQIDNKTIGKHMHITVPRIAGEIGKWIYDNKARCTYNFDVESTCIGCGLCAKCCPVHAIKMHDRRPIWIKDKCTMCLGCLHHCPKFAIQYGKNTKRHGQYQHY